MSTPRQILPERFLMLTRRCTQRLFLLRPDDETNNAFLYCLLEAAKRYEIEILLPSMMSNHHHTVMRDRNCMRIKFTEHLHKMLAKCMNVLRGRWENFWSAEEPSFVELADRGAVLDALVYAATNPVKDGLVERVSDWPGVNGLDALLGRRVLRARRPTFFFREDGPMPEEVEMVLQIPTDSELIGDPDVFCDDLRLAVHNEEARLAREREASGKRVLGRRRILRQSWRDSPTSLEPRRGLRPRVKAASKWARIATLQRNQQFVHDYRVARKQWLAGIPTVFPAGTYWLRVYANVPVRPIIKLAGANSKISN
jgi:putative transposase